MRNLFYCIVGVILISCSFNKENEYVTYDLNLGIFGNLYEISVPKNLANSNYKNGPGFSAWMNENDALFLRVYFKNDSVKEKMRVMVSEKKNKYASNGFYAIEESVTDSTNSITFSKEMQKLHSHTIIKQVELGYFVVELEGLNDCSYEDAQKIASSIKLRIKESGVVETYVADINESKCATYKNNLYSISYPSDWSYLERPDGVSDVYVGADTEKFGFSVFYLDDVEMTLEEIVEINNESQKSIGLFVVENVETEVAGYDAYKTVFIGELFGIKIKRISYSFLTEQGTFYNISFGNDAELIDKNSLLISRIIGSFKLNTEGNVQM
jgi:hypothetical protein